MQKHIHISLKVYCKVFDGKNLIVYCKNTLAGIENYLVETSLRTVKNPKQFNISFAFITEKYVIEKMNDYRLIEPGRFLLKIEHFATYYYYFFRSY